MPEKLYNGIALPEEWPPRGQNPYSNQPMRVPYLENPPEIIPIDLGRQLFVDDFLIEHSEIPRVFHQPVKYPGNPIFFPQTELERNDELPPTSIPKCGGVWYDGEERLFKMWYMASYVGAMAYAISRDGIHWERPELDIAPGTNMVLPPEVHPDSGTAWLDAEAEDPAQRYKLFVREPGGTFGGLMMTSPDGIHWSEPVKSGPLGDRSTLFYNPFRKKWVQSIRAYNKTRGRCRRYWEHGDFFQSGVWEENEPPFWTGADCMDESGDAPAQLYNLDAVAYESLLVGFYQIFKGPQNAFGIKSGLPKLTELNLATSRDGFHWHRPDRSAFIGARREPGSWEYGYVESTGGVLLAMGDELWIYYSAYGGDPDRISDKPLQGGMYANGAVGLAKLRRDGIASLQARCPESTVTTRALTFSGDRLFVNVNTAGSLLIAEILDENQQAIEGLGVKDCLGYCGNSTCAELRWKKKDNIASLAGRPVRVRFRMDRGDLYSFWVSSSSNGASHGYVAAGGPGFTGSRYV